MLRIFYCSPPVPYDSCKQGAKAVGRDIPAADRTARNKRLMIFIAYPEHEAEQHYYDHRKGPMGFMGKGMQTINKCAGKDGVGDKVQQFIDPGQWGELDKISMLIGQVENYPHDDCRGNESQKNLHSMTVSELNRNNSC